MRKILKLASICVIFFSIIFDINIDITENRLSVNFGQEVYASVTVDSGSLTLTSQANGSANQNTYDLYKLALSGNFLSIYGFSFASSGNVSLVEIKTINVAAIPDYAPLQLSLTYEYGVSQSTNGVEKITLQFSINKTNSIISNESITSSDNARVITRRSNSQISIGFGTASYRTYTANRHMFTLDMLNNFPIITINSPLMNECYNSSNSLISANVTLSDQDNDSLICKLFIDDEKEPRETKSLTNTSSPQSMTFNQINTSNFSEASHSLRFEVSDGKSTINDSVMIKVDRTGPTVGNVNLSTETDKISVIASASDLISGLTDNPYQYSIDQSNSNWMTTGVSNNISSSVINSAYDTSGNGGKKLVRLVNGWLVCVLKDPTDGLRPKFYKSTDNGATWVFLCQANTTNPSASVDVVLASTGTNVYCLYVMSNLAQIGLIKFDATTASGYINSITIDTQASYSPGCSIAIDSSGNLHAAWASKNSAYTYNYNIRYSKSIDGGATWATPTQITTINNTQQNVITPAIVIGANGYPLIVYVWQSSATDYSLGCAYFNGTTFINNYQKIFAAVSYIQSNPCVVVDSAGTIHAVWYSLDSTDTSKYNIRYSKSTDNGSTWSTSVKLTSGNSYNQINPSITCDNSGKLYVYWQGIDPAVNASYYNIRRAVFNGSSWSAVETLTSNTTNNAQNPSLCANFNSFAQPLYIYQDQQAGAVKFSGHISFPAEPFEVSGLLPNTPHEVTFKAKDKAGNISTWSQTVYTKTVQPTLTTLETTDTSMKLQVNDSNPSDTQYQISCGERYVNQLGEITQDTSWIRIPDKIITVTGLDNRVTYSFKIKARNGNGIESDASGSIAGTTGTTKPAVPENITTQPKSDSITIIWDEVLGAVSYDVETDGIVHTVTDNLYYTHEGLNSQTTHVYRIRARNGEGQAGDWSEEIIAETLKALPPTVTGLAATKTSTTVQLNWNEIDGGGVVYQVQADGKIIDTGFENSYLDESLTVNSRHTYRVRAVNSAGAGPWSNAVSVTTQFVAPTTPTNIVGVGSKTKIVVTWDKINDTTNYLIELKYDGDPNSAGLIIDNKTDTYRVIFGKPDSTYYIRIKAKNPAGESDWSDTVTIKTYALETPELSDVQESQHEVSLNWAAVEDASSYKIERNGQEVGSTDKLTYTDTGLMVETTYSYRVKAISSDNKESNWSYAAETITLPEKPPVPDHFCATAANGVVTLSWSAVAGAIAYDLEIDGVLIENDNSISYLYKDVAPRTEHLYRVRARNSGIEGDWNSGIKLTTLPDTIQAPSNISVSTTNTVTTVKWDKTPDAVRYQVEVDGLTVYNGTRNEFVHRSFDPNKEHVYRIRSIGYVETSDWSDRIVNNAVRLVCDKGKNAQIGLTASNVTDFSGYTLTVTYNPDVLLVDNLCTLTTEKELSIGKIKGTDVEIIQFEPGKIVFKVDKPIELGMSWSGIINRIGFKGKVTGGTTITYTVFIKPKTQ